MATERKYVTDTKGRKTAVVIDLREYRRLLKRLEDLEDALDLRSAKETATSFRDLSDIRASEAAARGKQ